MRKFLLMAMAAAVLAMPAAFGDPGSARRDYLKKTKALDDSDAAGRYMLARWCETEGLATEARLEFEKVLAIDPDHAGAREALGFVRFEGKWLTREEGMKAKGLELVDGEWLLPEEARLRRMSEAEKTLFAASEGKVRNLLLAMAKGDAKVERFAKQAIAGVEDEAKVAPLAYALRYPAENVRAFAATELGRIGDRRALRPLIHRSIVDPSETVRLAAVAAVKTFEDPNLLSPYVKAMWSENESVRIHAAQAVGELGDVIGIEYLVYRLKAHGGGIGRSHIYLANQLSFIQDFDVEVAQTAFIADPLVATIQEGSVLDVQVLATERTAYLVERRAVRSALSKLAGVDLGDSPSEWAKWWGENRERLLASR